VCACGLCVCHEVHMLGKCEGALIMGCVKACELVHVFILFPVLL
jgi:hypothetical protein